jgi:3-oxoacyl-[acyl-carrier protein] reductase
VVRVVVYPDDTRAGDPVAIVTGGSRGLGRAAARVLAGCGYAVVISYAQDQPEAEAAVEELLAANGTALAVRADLTDELDVERLFNETIEAFGGVDVVVQTAIRGAFVVDRQAARQLRRGVLVVDVSGSEATTLVLAQELRTRRRRRGGR